MRRLHLIFGSVGVLAFLITGQIMRHHVPPMESLVPAVHMMYVSRHIYLLGAALLNLVLGLHLQQRPAGARRAMQWTGTVLVLISPVLLLLAFGTEPELGLAGRSWKSQFGLFTLFGGAMIHALAVVI